MSYEKDPYAYAATKESFKGDTPPLNMKVVGNSTTKIKFKAAAKINKTIPKDEYEVGPEGVLTQYLISDLDSFLKVSFCFVLQH